MMIAIATLPAKRSVPIKVFLLMVVVVSTMLETMHSFRMTSLSKEDARRT